MSNDKINTLGDEFFHPDGRMKTLAERQAEQRMADNAAHNVRQAVDIRKREVQKQEPHDARLLRVYQDDLKQLKRERSYSAPLERAYYNRRIEHLEIEIDKLESQFAEQERLATLDADVRVRNVRDSAAALARSGQRIYPGANPEDLATMIDIAKSNDLSPDELHAAYWDLETKVLSDSKEFIEAEAARKRDAAIKANHESAQAELQRADVTLRHHRATSNDGAADAE